MKLSYLVKGFPGHPLHRPLTNATIGLYTGAATFGVLSVLGVSEQNTARAWWLALVVGLVVTVPPALTGLIDWLSITWRTPLWRAVRLHLSSMVTATVFFLIARRGRPDRRGRCGGGRSSRMTFKAWAEAVERIRGGLRVQANTGRSAA
jgi:hypothetical protein